MLMLIVNMTLLFPILHIQQL